ncbi:MAG: phosphate signaling complex protein PhoU [Planctomycetes bacterium]|nr:phosphate signaling complex protein PhoU [Planctomycetota bacterium]
MAKHLQRGLENLKKELLILGAMVEEATNRAITALIERRADLAQAVLERDDQIDEKEVAVEEDCLKILALNQPVAADLRFIITVLKVNNDLERMGDLAVNIAERAAYLATHEPISVPLDFTRMGDNVRVMVRESLDALVNRDAVLARKILDDDDAVDDANRQMYDVLQKLMHQEPAAIERAIHLLSASRHLERIADLATNIAEDVVFLVEGEVIRHRTEDYRKKGPRAVNPTPYTWPESQGNAQGEIKVARSKTPPR